MTWLSGESRTSLIFIHGITPGRFPLAGVMELPIGVPSGKIGSRVMWSSTKNI